jgi:hypothetical protein
MVREADMKNVWTYFKKISEQDNFLAKQFFEHCRVVIKNFPHK